MLQARWLRTGSAGLFLLTSCAACSTVKAAPHLPSPGQPAILATVWKFATDDLLPPRSPIPECPEWDVAMTAEGGNELLGQKFELCRAALAAAKARIALWETWTDGEIEAQSQARRQGSR